MSRFCGRCGAPLARPDQRFCTRCGTPVPQADSGAPRPGDGPTNPGMSEPYPPIPGPGGPSGRPPGRSPLNAILGALLVVAAIGVVAALWMLTSSSSSPAAMLGLAPAPTATHTPLPTPTPVPTPTRGPSINIPIPGATATISIPISIPNFGASPTPPPNTKLTADQAREKVKASLSSCFLLRQEIELANVTYEPPNWLVTLRITQATWRVDDATGTVTPDERAAERQKNCRL
ncbi:MAG: zinc ribbon domain-containing protein [Chloroflexi bacterium]|nr:zinc ribbon domain-containing protein [Chloroflexota bacterium]